MSTKRDALREQALKPRPPKSQIVEFDGVKYEIRAPSVKARSKILEKAGAYVAALDKTGKKQVDVAAMQVASVIYCTFVPQSEDEIRAGAEPEPVFDDGDFEELANKPAGDIIDVLAEVAMPMVNVAADGAAAKNG